MSHTQAATTNTMAQNDDVQREVDGICCFNFQASNIVVTPEVPWTPALLVLGTGLIAVGALTRRRRPVTPA